MNQALLNGLVMVAVPESATRDDMLASLVHPLPMMSLVAPVGLFVETRDTALIGRQASGRSWLVPLPLLFMRGWQSWPALAVVTVLLCSPAMRLLRVARIQLWNLFP